MKTVTIKILDVSNNIRKKIGFKRNIVRDIEGHPHKVFSVGQYVYDFQCSSFLLVDLSDCVVPFPFNLKDFL